MSRSVREAGKTERQFYRRHGVSESERESSRRGPIAELAGDDDACTALGITVKSPSPVLALCRKLVDAGHDPATPLEAYRGATLALRVKSIGRAAGLEVSPRGVGFVRQPDCQRAPPMRYFQESQNDTPDPLPAPLDQPAPPDQPMRVPVRSCVGEW
jgi:hypothetical protein